MANNSSFQSSDTGSERSLRAFLCHSSDDKPRVRDLYKRLRVQGVDPWLDQENLLPGQNWQQEIRDIMRIIDVVIVCLSQNSINKVGFVQKEIMFALDVAEEYPNNTIFIIPIKLEKCVIPDRLSHLHAVNLYEKRGFEFLMRSLRTRASILGVVLKPISKVKPTSFQSSNEGKNNIDVTFVNIVDDSELDADLSSSMTAEQVIQSLIAENFISKLNDPTRSYLLTIKGRNNIQEGQTLSDAGVRLSDRILVNLIQRGA